MKDDQQLDIATLQHCTVGKTKAGKVESQIVVGTPGKVQDIKMHTIFFRSSLFALTYLLM